MIMRGTSMRWTIVSALVVVLPVRTTYGQTASGASSPGASPDRNHQLTIVRWPLTINAALLNVTPLDTSQSQTLADSLNLKLLDIAIAKAELTVNKTRFWHRLIPSVSVSTSLGVSQLAFIDPTTSTPYIFPKDSYRLNATLSLSDIFDDTRHEEAILDLLRLQIQKDLTQEEYKAKRNRRLYEIRSLDYKLSTLSEELTLVQHILDFKQLLYDQGKADFDELSRTQISLLHLKQTIDELSIKRLTLQRGLE